MLSLSLLNFLIQLSECLHVPPQVPLVHERLSFSSPPHALSGNGNRKLKGRFLHITDIHPDPFYKVYTGTNSEEACHGGSGPAGYYGAETTDCDSPYSLVNATFEWIDKNLKDTIDFIIWTGDSARHDNDEAHPRDENQVLNLNIMLVNKFNEVFSNGKNHDDPDPTNDLLIPIVPTFGNNDILPHNILAKGPNKWTEKYSQIWRQFIPEEQRHAFGRGGWFYVEVIPNKLAVFSLNTMYFFDKNSAVDGCALKSEPGYEHMEWLRIQLEFIRQRGMKAIIAGHVPPARTKGKANWDETCWQKYALWMQRYRDVVVGSIYGHMNIDHFIVQDFKDIDVYVADGSKQPKQKKSNLGKEFSVNSESDYLLDLRKEWSKIPNPPSKLAVRKQKKGKKSDDEKFFKKIGGVWAERYAVSHVSASVVPNYFPSLRVFEYNITGIEKSHEISVNPTKSKKHKKKKPKKPKKPNFRVPKAPSKASPPGPAYSPQTFSLLGYTQYYANITYINHDFDRSSVSMISSFLSLLNPIDQLIGNHQGNGISSLEKAKILRHDQKWNSGKHPDKKPHVHPKPNPRNFTFSIEFDTQDADDVYGFNNRTGLCVRAYVDLAARLGKFDPKKASRKQILNILRNDKTSTDNIQKIVEKQDKRTKGVRKNINQTWFTFLRRAFVGAIGYDDLKDMFGENQLFRPRTKKDSRGKDDAPTDLK